MNQFKSLFWRFVNSETGPKTIHFWAPVFNWGFPIQGYLDRNRPPENISRDFQFVLCSYSMIFMRFAWMVKPRNYLLFVMHFTNEIFQLNLLQRRLAYDSQQKKISRTINCLTISEILIKKIIFEFG